jgi:tRNA(adenine34) deaminase
MMKDAHHYLQCCFQLAKQAAQKGNSSVGALIVKNDKIISEAEEAVKTKNDISCHAEMEAIRKAVKNLHANDLSGCTLYTTHEPCIMCSYAIRYHKIKEVVYVHQSQYLGGVSSSMPLLISTEVPASWSKPPIINHIKENLD